MAEYLIQGDSLTALANAIREKTGSTDALYVSDMVDAVGRLKQVEVNTTETSGPLNGFTFTGCGFIPNVLFIAPPPQEDGHIYGYTDLLSLSYVNGTATVTRMNYDGAYREPIIKQIQSFNIGVHTEGYAFQVTYTDDDIVVDIPAGTTWIAAKI